MLAGTVMPAKWYGIRIVEDVVKERFRGNWGARVGCPRAVQGRGRKCRVRFMPEVYGLRWTGESA